MKKEIVHLQSIEEKLVVAKELEDGKTYAEEDVWKMFSKNMDFDLYSKSSSYGTFILIHSYLRN